MSDPLDPQVPPEKPQPPTAAPSKSGTGRFGGGRKKLDEITLYSAPPAFFLWVVIAVGFLLRWLCPGIITAGAGAWIFIFTLIYFLLAMLYDLSLKKLVLCTLVVSVLWLFAKYMEGLHNVVILGSIMKYFAALAPQFDPGTVTVICWLLLILWVAAILEMVFNRRKKFTPNEIAEYHFGEGSERTDRTGLRFMTKYRDVLETLLGFGGGDLIAVDNQQRVIKRYENIVGLWFHWKRLDHILQQRSILVEEDDCEPEDPKSEV
jgi:hypothetical protein